MTSAERNKARREKCRALGLCSRCLGPHVGSRFVYCDTCRNHDKKRSSAWYRQNREFVLTRKRMSGLRRRIAVLQAQLAAVTESVRASRQRKQAA